MPYSISRCIFYYFCMKQLLFLSINFFINHIQRDVSRARSGVLEASTLVVTGPDLSLDLIHERLENSVPVSMANIVLKIAYTFLTI